MLVRGDGLAESMSVISFSASKGSTIALRTKTKSWPSRHEPSRAGAMAGQSEREHRDSCDQAVFLMTGAFPPRMAPGCVALDAKGFIKTGPSLSPEDLAAAQWPSPGAPPPRNQPAGRLRRGRRAGGNVKRVASAVGEGSIAVAFVHQVLHE